MTATHEPPAIHTEHASAFDAHKHFFHAQLRLQSISSRRAKLKNLQKWIFENQSEIQKALLADFQKAPVETDISEIMPVLTEIKDARANLRDWTRPKKVSTPISLIGTSARVRYEPKGIVLIIAPWNFPFMLAAGPMVSAIAAGCAIMIKPSEMAPATAELLARMCQELFPQEEISVHQGDHTVATSLLKLPFNHIFFTGSPQVGKIVMRAAADNLTSVTLELGGMNPVIVDETANIKSAAKRLAWGKFMNCGQACVAPNYIYVHESIKDKLISEVKLAIAKLYDKEGEAIRKNKDFARIINKRHFNRIKSLMDDSVEKGAKIIYGGETAEEECYIAPTLVVDVPRDAPLLHDEIFGPVLPFLTYKNVDEALAHINSEPDPLAFYIFSSKEKRIRYVLDRTQAGTTGINEVTAQFGHPHLPFGGHNNSGIGKAHGHYGFMAFTQERAIIRKSLPISSPQFIFPPYNNFVKRLVGIINRWF